MSHLKGCFERGVEGDRLVKKCSNVKIGWRALFVSVYTLRFLKQAKEL